ncbi:MAG TPA: tetratricopeptide repeat protein [Abditibacteriaceae bacterium]|jgi:tetratricopeptide (TPR) repeat protein
MKRFLTFILFLSFCSAANAQSGEESAAIKEGEKQSKESYPARAIESYNRALEINPKSQEALYGRAWANIDAGNHDRAIADFGRLIELEPQSAPSYFGRGYAWGNKNEYQKAIDNFTRTIEIKPESELLAEAHVYRGLNRKALGEYDEATRDFETAMKVDPQNAGSWAGRALVRQAKGDAAGSQADIDKAESIDPDYARVTDNYSGFSTRTLILRGVIAVVAIAVAFGGFAMIKTLVAISRSDKPAQT